jgi:hypothetical protein
MTCQQGVTQTCVQCFADRVLSIHTGAANLSVGLQVIAYEAFGRRPTPRAQGPPIVAVHRKFLNGQPNRYGTRLRRVHLKRAEQSAYRLPLVGGR